MMNLGIVFRAHMVIAVGNTIYDLKFTIANIMIYCNESCIYFNDKTFIL